MRKRRVKVSQKPNALSGGEEKKQSSRLGLNGAIDPVPEEDTPNRGPAQASRQVYARYLSHFSDLKAFNQLCQGACQSCQTMSGCSVDTKRWWGGGRRLCIILRGGICMCSFPHPVCPSKHHTTLAVPLARHIYRHMTRRSELHGFLHGLMEPSNLPVTGRFVDQY